MTEKTAVCEPLPGGLFITFEGPEGAGKSTQMELLATTLRRRGYAVLTTREPGGTPLGEELRKLVKHLGGEAAPCPEAELLLMGASRAQHATKVIAPFLRQGGIVLCDRYADSTTVYQGAGRGLDLGFIADMHQMSTCGCWPALTIVLDVPAEVGLQRSRQRNYGPGVVDRFEEESLAFHRRIRQGFVDLADGEPARVKLFDTQNPVAEVQAAIMGEVARVLAG